MKIILIIFLKSIINIEFFCKRNILESYKLYGRNKPISKTMLICPTITSNCCLRHDERLIYKIYNYKIKNKTKVYFQKIMKYLTLTGKFLADFGFSNLEKKIKDLKGDETEKKGILTMYNDLIERSIVDYYHKMIKEAPKALNYLQESREGFYCALCEFKNHRYFDLKKKEIYFSDRFCRGILNHTLEYNFYLYGIIIPFIADLVKFYSILGTLYNKNILNSIDFFHRNKKVTSQVINCINEQKKEKFIRSCSLFCENFKINSNSREWEGDLELLMRFVDEARQFEEIIKPKSSMWIKYKKLINLRKLESGSNYYFDISQQENELEIQPKISSKKKLSGFEDLIDENDEYLNNEDLFKMVSDDLIDFNNFSSRFDGTGIDYMKFFSEANFSVTMKEIIKFNGIRKALNYDDEIAEKKILNQINSINNSDIRNFHRDAKLYFKQFKLSSLNLIGGIFIPLKKRRRVVRISKRLKEKKKEQKKNKNF